MEAQRSRTRGPDTHLGASLPDMLMQQVEAQPDTVAAVYGDQQLTYRDLAVASTNLAAHLRELGVAADACVGLYVDPSLDLMVGAWGVLFAGGAYLPLSPDYPEARLRFMVEDSRASVIVTQAHLRDRLAELVRPGTRLVTLDEVEQAGREPGPVRVGSRSLAYVIYTSGSTGRPNGVMIEHHSVVSQMRWMHTFGHLGRDTTVLQKTPVSFDAAQWELLAPVCGSRVVVGAPGIYRDPDLLSQTINAHGVTSLQCVPTLLQALLDTEQFRTCQSLRRVFSGGEVLSRQLARQLTEELPWVSLVNLYGPTECTINATAFLVDPEAIDEGGGSVPIGVPVDNTPCFIVDENLAPVDIGETGELYIGGTQLARGYLHQPDLTRQRFVPSMFVPTERLYRTGDLAYWNPDGTIQFVGRVDNQVKLRGFRVELDEIAQAIEEHPWVRRAAAVVTDDARTGSQNLVACVELNAKEAALMDQGNHGAHHQSKASKLQVKAQLSNPGVREDLARRPAVYLPGRQPSARQWRETFARKTYRFFEGEQVGRTDLLGLLAARPVGGPVRELGELTLPQLGAVVRWFGQFHSDDRLLPKYSYASPGALYATQMYLELCGVADLEDGLYYHDPAEHRLVRIGPAELSGGPRMELHFLGRRGAIEPVYRNNIREVLELEAGHMIGVLEEVLPEYGLTVRALDYRVPIKGRLDVAEEDFYLGTFEVVPNHPKPGSDPTEIYLQVHPGRVDGLAAGQYRYADGELTRISDELVLPQHVIAINQQVYERASFGVTAVSRAAEPWLEYVCLGTTLHHLQRNGLRLGLMSSGYSSKTGHPLPAAQRIDAILASCGIAPAASYFFLGGRVSQEQVDSTGMHEDSVHMKGPTEMIKEGISQLLPDYMMPNRVLVVDSMPLTANGKIDCTQLAASEAVQSGQSASGPYIAPATRSEAWLANAWGEALKYENVSVEDEFFACGGNSLIAVRLVNTINREFGTQLPLQVVFQFPTLADLAAQIDEDRPAASSRLVPLHDHADARPVFCWPGLGGYPMNLRQLAREAGVGAPFYGVQTCGINAGEVTYPTIREMAAADVTEIRRVQPEGPYTLWGYSFGARVAFETAWQLERAGERVENLLLLCPGNPRVRAGGQDRHRRNASYANRVYVTILFSVFAGTVGGPEVERCLATARDDDTFVAFVCSRFPQLDEQVVRRIVRIVAETYEFDYAFSELAERRLDAAVTIFKAEGDDYSFIEGRSGYSAIPPEVVDLTGDHYNVLGQRGVGELAAAIRSRLGR